MERTLFRSKPEIRSVWSLDPVNSFVTFSVLHRRISRICGRFDEFDGSLQVCEGAGGDLSLMLSIQAGSINTGHLRRDSDLRSDLFLDAARFPTITFTGNRIAPNGHELGRIEGSLSLHGIERPIAIRAVMHGSSPDASDRERLGLQAQMKVDRRLFEIGWTRVLPPNCAELGRHVAVSIEAQFIRAEGVYKVA